MFRASLFRLAAGCAIGGGDSTGDSAAPLVGVDGSTDQADARLTRDTSDTCDGGGAIDRVGNDARFAFNLRTIDPFRAYHCPDVATAPTEDGMYLAAPVELYFVVNGVELRGDGGAPFTGPFIDYLSDPFRDASCQ